MQAASRGRSRSAEPAYGRQHQHQRPGSRQHATADNSPEPRDMGDVQLPDLSGESQGRRNSWEANKLTAHPTGV